MDRDGPPSAVRIAEILRAGDPWPKAADMGNPLDVAQRLVSQQRRLVDQGVVTPILGNGGGMSLLKYPEAGGGAIASMSGYSDAKVTQLAERTSLLLANIQRQNDADRQDLERQLDEMGGRVEARIAGLEGRLQECEIHAVAKDRRDAEQGSTEAARVLQEARAMVSGAVNEVQTQWRSYRADTRQEQEEQMQHIEDLRRQNEQNASRLLDMEHTTGGSRQCLQRLDQIEERWNAPMEPPAWFDQLEDAVSGLERRFEEQRASVEVRLQQLRADAEGLKMRCEAIPNLHDELLRSVDRRLEQEFDKLEADREQQHEVRLPVVDSGHSAFAAKASQDLGRRVDDMEAKMAALRVRVDGHDGRFSSLAERAEAACQQAGEQARQASLQLREEILQEADCQVKILRQRVEALGELCDELSMREVSRRGQRTGLYQYRSDAETGVGSGGKASG